MASIMDCEGFLAILNAVLSVVVHEKPPSPAHGYYEFRERYPYHPRPDPVGIDQHPQDVDQDREKEEKISDSHLRRMRVTLLLKLFLIAILNTPPFAIYLRHHK